MNDGDARWARLKEIVASSLELDGTDRNAYVTRECGADRQLRAEVESLLAHADSTEGFLESPPSASIDAGAGDALIGRRIGAFRIVALIAEGGMGEVYRAERDDGQFKQQVAIKLIRHGLGSTLMLERFQVERQILASLDHPNIARLFDGGLTEERLPYLVMELIDGEPIDRYCARKQLSIAEILELFREVCASVHYAHQRLVVHRDLKPSNILVTANGAPKLLDFGIAKVLAVESPNADAASNVTVLRAMTPDYSSPEQIRGDVVTTSTDIYSLGVVLYRLLSGRSPYRVETMDRYAAAKAICESEPTKPSAQIASTSPGIAKLLRGDLDSIVLKAMRKEPEQRYASAEQFAEDIRRYLAHQPIIARKGTTTYRAGRFLARNKLAAAAGAIIFITLIGGLVATQRQARIATAERQRAVLEQARAEKRFNDVRELSDSLIFDVHDAIRNLPGATAARELLLDRAVKYLDRVAADAIGDSALQRELAWGYQRLAVVQGSKTESNLGDHAGALATDRKALALFQAVSDHNPADVVDQLNVAMMHRIIAYDAFTAENRAHLDLAMQTTSKLLLLDPTNPKVHSERSLELQHLGFMYDSAGNRARALQSFRDALAQKNEVRRYKPDYRNIDLATGNATVLVGDALVRIGNREEAITTIKKGLEWLAAQPNGGGDLLLQSNVAQSHYKLGDVFLMNGNTTEAAANYAQGRRVAEQLVHADEKDTEFQSLIAMADFNAARSFAAAGRWSEAASIFRRIQQQSEALFSGADSIESSLVNSGVIAFWLGVSDFHLGRIDESARDFQIAATLLATDPAKIVNDDRRCQVATNQIAAAKVLIAKKNFDEARRKLNEALQLIDTALTEELQDVPARYVSANARAVLGDIAIEQSRFARSAVEQDRLRDEARHAYEQSLATFKTIPHASRIDAIGLPSLIEQDVAERLARWSRQ